MNYLVLAMGRSGHHAIIDWIGERCYGEAVHYNNVIRGWEYGELIPNKNKVRKLNNSDGKENSIYSIEDVPADEMEKLDPYYFNQLKNTVAIIVIRDPRNWLASSIKIGGDAYNYLDKPINKDRLYCSRIDAYKSHLHEALGNTYNIKMPRTFVLYDKWFECSEYRDIVSFRLGLINIPGIPGKVSGFAGGSSFDKKRYDGKANKMNVLTRYKSMANNSDYKRLLDDEMIHSYLQLEKIA